MRLRLDWSKGVRGFGSGVGGCAGVGVRRRGCLLRLPMCLPVLQVRVLKILLAALMLTHMQTRQTLL
eukprot:2456771-Rhodomonas_salina.2